MNIRNIAAVTSPEKMGIRMIRVETRASGFIFQGVKGVACPPFEMAETPFTIGHYRYLLENHTDALDRVVVNSEEILKRSLGMADIRGKEADKCPLVCISNSEAEKTSALIGCRLSTELEWERAAAGLNGRKNYQESCAYEHVLNAIKAVDEFPSVKVDGFYGLDGNNVQEWTSSLCGRRFIYDYELDGADPKKIIYHLDLSDPPKPQWPLFGDKVVRGGRREDYSDTNYLTQRACWGIKNTDGAPLTNRFCRNSDDRDGRLGFRLAR